MVAKLKQSVSERIEAGSITETEAFELTREAALSSLDRAMQSRHTLAGRLIQRGYPAVTVEGVLDRLEAVGLVNDAEYAQSLVRARLDRGLAKRAIGVELARKGIASDAAGQALAQIDSGQQAEAAELVARKVINRCQGLTREVKANRAYGAVSRRGYPAEIAAAAVTKALGSTEDEF